MGNLIKQTILDPHFGNTGRNLNYHLGKQGYIKDIRIFFLFFLLIRHDLPARKFTTTHSDRVHFFDFGIWTTFGKGRTKVLELLEVG
jgi:hypothetical protein